MPKIQTNETAQEWNFLLSSTRARVYLVWAAVVPFGFVATNFYQKHAINALWTVIAIVGLGYMLRVMPIKQRQMQRIWFAWFVPIMIGLVVSGAVFYVHDSLAAQLLGHLGAFWLAVIAFGFFLNGLVDRPSKWYWCAVILSACASICCFRIAAFTAGQYLIAAIVTAWSMLNLWLFRSILK